MRRVLRAAAAAVALMGGLGFGVVPAGAAELRVSFAELAGVVQAVLGDAKVHLHNKSGGLLNLTSGSYVQLAGQQIAVPLAPKSFEVLGSTYAYYVDDVNTTSVKVSAVPSALRLTLTFESKGDELTAGCIQGGCSLADALPVINWQNGSVSVDLVPVRYGASLALMAKSVTIGGDIKPSCASSGGFFSEGACDLALGWAERAIAKLRPDIVNTLKDKINDPQIQASIAENVKKHLTLGPAGAITITNVATDSKGVTITFVMAGAVGG